jgi:hypothetical protein
MDNKELKEQLIKLRNTLQDYLDNMNMSEADEGKAKGKYKKENKDVEPA